MENPAAVKLRKSDLPIAGKVSDRPEVRPKMCRSSFLEQLRCRPGATRQVALEIAAADKEQSRVDPCGTEGAARELCHRTGAGPLVREDNEAHPHR